MQVPRILNPVVLVLESLPKLCKDPRIHQLVQSSWGGIDECRCCLCSVSRQLAAPLRALPALSDIAVDGCSVAVLAAACS